jgi:hypothetical protein
MIAESFSCCEKVDWRRNNCEDIKISRIMVVKTVTLGRGSEAIVGRKSQYTRTWPGLKKQNNRRQIGIGSQTASSHTSRVGSGCALDSALVSPSMLVRNLSGEEATGDESTRTRCAEGVD